ncbi:hypothetical protein BDK51DRAFT_37700 [Blyttiomyces helicus]|uniref:BLOC-1-related complex subunit 5 n=1 Tax=Blyttiomyces helicus TaxID=388810 RepID=A0A4P9W0I3_9FUNG|nr:hypothetical protein BDK51DRAFT_37700 [Blyttiomyces helicus]|eukprot:RKO84188.1 hypothetical protein BDK51DRAFT_37700 [Blyttiomyces helicus]
MDEPNIEPVIFAHPAALAVQEYPSTQSSTLGFPAMAPDPHPSSSPAPHTPPSPPPALPPRPSLSPSHPTAQTLSPILTSFPTFHPSGPPSTAPTLTPAVATAAFAKHVGVLSVAIEDLALSAGGSLGWAGGGAETAEEGIVTVVERGEVGEVDPVLEALARIPRIEPLIKESAAQGFTWGGLFSAPPKQQVDPLFTMNPAPLEAMATRVRTHMRRCTDDIVRDQKTISESIANMDDYCHKLANTVTNRCYAAKVQGEQLAGITNIKKQAEKTHSQLLDVLASLEKLDELLPPSQRLGQPEEEGTYPALTKMLAARRRQEGAEEEGKGKGRASAES